jgi:HEAT repeat protein
MACLAACVLLATSSHLALAQRHFAFLDQRPDVRARLETLENQAPRSVREELDAIRTAGGWPMPSAEKLKALKRLAAMHPPPAGATLVALHMLTDPGGIETRKETRGRPPVAQTERVADAAVDLLVRIGEPAFEPLVLAVTTRELPPMPPADRTWRDRTAPGDAALRYGRLREQAARTLAKMKDPRAVEPLIDGLMISSCHFGLALVDALNAIEPRWMERRAATAVVPRHIERLRNAVSWSDRACAAKTLGLLREPTAIDALVEALGEQRLTEPHVANDAALALGRIGDLRAVPALVAALTRASPHGTPGRAAEALAHLEDRRAVAPLIALLEDAASADRSAAATALGQLKDPRATAPLLDALAQSDAELGGAAARALGRLGDTSAVPALIIQLKHLNAGVRSSAAMALGQLGDERALAPLIEALGDREPSVRAVVVSALGGLKSARAIDALIGALLDNDTRGGASQALSAVTGEQFGTDIERWRRWQRQGAR